MSTIIHLLNLKEYSGQVNKINKDEQKGLFLKAIKE